MSVGQWPHLFVPFRLPESQQLFGNGTHRIFAKTVGANIIDLLARDNGRKRNPSDLTTEVLALSYVASNE